MDDRSVATRVRNRVGFVKPPGNFRRLLFGLLIMAGAVPVGADELRIAVASNFAGAAREIASRFEQESGHRVVVASGATGKHYAQIINGAPFDVFLAADAERPELLESSGVALAGSRFTYALGELVLWSPRSGYVDTDGQVLETGDFRRLAIANPKIAPYGRAAREVLTAAGLWEALQPRLVRGENIAQTFQFVGSGNAELGFVARSQVQRPGSVIDGSRWAVPQSLYAPIVQQAVLLAENDAARAFARYLQGVEARKIIRDFGYGLPDDH
jgi:molybdate transport system substrate-binding protein